MAGRGVGAAWVQGARPLSLSVIPWQELLHRRIRGEFNLVPSGPKTLDAEALLGIDRHSYFYVTRTHPSFGDNSLAFDPQLLSSGSVTPFDTGGLAFDHVVTKPPLASSEKGLLLDKYTYDAESYEISMQKWVDVAFSGVTEYVEGQTPEFSFVPEVDLSACSEQAWTWEARLALEPLFTPSPDAAARVFVSPGRRGAYLEWLRRQKILGPDELTPHLRRVAQLVIETDNPVDAMKNHLRGLV